MKDSRIHAIEDVELEAPPGVAEELVWFYTDVGRLDQVLDGVDGATELRFRSASLELRFRFVEAPRVDPVPVRLTLFVPSLAEASEALVGRSVRFDWERGLSYTDRRVLVLDPAGHRVALRQEWALL